MAKAAKAKQPTKSGSGISRQLAQEILQWLAREQRQIVGAIKDIVEMETPSHSKLAIDALGKHLAQEFKRIGGRATLHPQRKAGDHLQVDFPAAKRGDASAKPILLLGHIDTVWEIGTLRSMPFLIQKGRLWGPGVYDM